MHLISIAYFTLFVNIFPNFVQATLRLETEHPQTNNDNEYCDSLVQAYGSIILKSGGTKQKLIANGRLDQTTGEGTEISKARGTFSTKKICEVARHHRFDSVGASIRITQEYYGDQGNKPEAKANRMRKIGRISCIRKTNLEGGKQNN